MDINRNFVIDQIKHYFLKFKNNSDLISFTWLASGPFFIFVSQVVLTPVLTRIYTPSDYGTFAIFNAISQIILPAITASLFIAIPLAKNNTKYVRLVYNIFVYMLLSTLLFTCLLVVFKSQIINLFGIAEVDTILILLIPLFCLLISLFLVCYYIYVRADNFKLAGRSELIRGLSTKAFALIFGFIPSVQAVGLILSEFFAYIIALTFQLVSLKKVNKFVVHFLLYLYNKFFLRLRIYLRHTNEFMEYPKFVLPSQWVNVLISQAPILFFGFVYSVSQIGAFGLAGSLLVIPIRLLSQSFQPIFLKRLINENVPENNVRYVNSVFKLYLFSGIGLCLIVLVSSQLFFVKIFGEEWWLSVKVISISSFLLVVALLVPLSASIYQYLRIQKFNFYFNLLHLTLIAIAAVVVVVAKADFLTAVTLLVISKLIVNFAMVLHAKKMMKDSVLE